MTTAARTAIVWDMGGILYRYFTEILLDLAPTRGWNLEGVPMGPTGNTPDEAYARMLTGEIEEPEYLVEVRARFSAAGLDVDPVTVIDWDGELRPEAMAVVEAAHDAGHPQAVLTNDASRWLGDDWWHAWEEGHWFDAMIDVATLESRKPAPGPYLEAARVLDLEPGDCVFVDDLPVNGVGAEAVGMMSHIVDVRDPRGSMRRLAKRLDLAVPALDA